MDALLVTLDLFKGLITLAEVAKFRTSPPFPATAAVCLLGDKIEPLRDRGEGGVELTPGVAVAAAAPAAAAAAEVADKSTIASAGRRVPRMSPSPPNISPPPRVIDTSSLYFSLCASLPDSSSVS